MHADLWRRLVDEAIAEVGAPYEILAVVTTAGLAHHVATLRHLETQAHVTVKVDRDLDPGAVKSIVMRQIRGQT